MAVLSPVSAAGDFNEESDDSEAQDAASETRHLAVGSAQHGERLDRSLAQMVPEFSRSYLQQLVVAGAVRVNDQVVLKPAQRIKAADAIALEMRPTQESQAFRAEDIALDVVYQDPHLLVVNKPAGLVVHPAPGNWSGTLLNALLGRDAAAAQVPRAGIVHRLDKDTSGLMVVARTRSAMDALVRMMAARDIHRQYLAIARGHWPGAAECEVNAAIGRDPRNRLRMAVVDLERQAGKPARTDIRLLRQGAGHCLVRCTLHTGRTHQIRVHMAHLGLPLVGDVLYGGVPDIGLARQGLHAFHLEFAHPMEGKALAFDVQPPPDMLHALEAAGLA